MEVREEVRQLAGPLAEESGAELVDVELAVRGSRRVVRVLLDRPGGITIGDCAAFSRRLSDCLEMNQTIAGSYDLEVSSPGIERPIRTLDAVARFKGHRVVVTLRDALDGRRHFEGELLGPEADRAGVKLDDGQTHWFDWAGVRTARLVVDPWSAVRSRGRAR